MCSLGVNQKARLNLGRDVASLCYFTVCGLLEGYKPFAVNMARDPALWMSWRQPQFIPVQTDHDSIQVSHHTSTSQPDLNQGGILQSRNNELVTYSNFDKQPEITIDLCFRYVFSFVESIRSMPISSLSFKQNVKLYDNI